MAIRDLSCSSAVVHIDLENTGIARTAISMSILQAPWMISSRVSICCGTKPFRSLGDKKESNIRHRHVHTCSNKRANFVGSIAIPRRRFVEVPVAFHRDARNPGKD